MPAGVFAQLTNAYAVIALGGAENFYSVFESELADHIPVIKTSIAGTRLVGRMTVGNKNGLLVPNSTTDQVGTCEQRGSLEYRACLWPLHSHGSRRKVSLVFICFQETTARTSKQIDTLVVTQQARSLPFHCCAHSHPTFCPAHRSCSTSATACLMRWWCSALMSG
jgi:hypothetical protein